MNEQVEERIPDSTPYDESVSRLFGEGGEGRAITPLLPNMDAHGAPDQFRPVSEFAGRVLREADYKTDELVRESNVRLDGHLKLPDGSPLTRHALKQLAILSEMPWPVARWHVENGESVDLARHINNGLNTRETSYANRRAETIRRRAERREAGERNINPLRSKESREFFIRRRHPHGSESGGPRGIVRAILTERYSADLDNVLAWRMLEAAAREVRGRREFDGVLSNYGFSDGDGFGGSLLFPDDTVYIKDDSEYRFGVHVRNCEIGRYSFTISPFCFRSFCQNGAIFDKSALGNGVKVFHHGKINEDDLTREVTAAMRSALEDGKRFVKQMEIARDITVTDRKDVTIPKMIASLSRELHLSGEGIGRRWFKGYGTEVEEGAREGSVFALVNGLTRAAQRYREHERMNIERAAGKILSPSLDAARGMIESTWGGYANKAAHMKDDDARQFVGLLSEV